MEDEIADVVKNFLKESKIYNVNCQFNENSLNFNVFLKKFKDTVSQYKYCFFNSEFSDLPSPIDL